jgi:hypothetical protein
MQSRQAWPGIRATRLGVSLLEVLLSIGIISVILILAIKLYIEQTNNLALAISDDRTAAIASDARALGEAGQELVSRTADFLAAALAAGSVDADAAAQLRADYEQFAAAAAALKRQLEELRDVYPRQALQRYLGPLLAQARTIETRLTLLIDRFLLLERGDAGR